MVPVLCSATAGDKKVATADKEWIRQVQQLVRVRGGEVIKARDGKSSAASAAKAALDHMHDWHFGTENVVSVALPAPKDNKYGVPEGIIFSFPAVCRNGVWHIVDLDYHSDLDDDIARTIANLMDERKLALGE